MMTETSRKCPQCAEEIRTDAIKCKHCGAFVASEAWREMAQRWASMDQAGRDKQWAELSEEQRVTFKAVWDALGLNSPAVSAPAVVVQKGNSGCWWIVVIALGIIAAVVIASLF